MGGIPGMPDMGGIPGIPGPDGGTEPGGPKSVHQLRTGRVRWGSGLFTRSLESMMAFWERLRF